MKTRNSFLLAGFALAISSVDNTAIAQENAACNQLRATVSAAIETFARIGPRLEQLEKIAGAAAADEQRQLARTGLERATASEDALIRLQSLRCLNFGGRPVDWTNMLNESRKLKANFTTASKRQ